MRALFPAKTWPRDALDTATAVSHFLPLIESLND